ncbi:hypothetical protein ZIOFF_046341 [Zingiber officinale]|uniref:Disease resistance R13L4/SHOC-2-like LRR domain-containing protein n=1 Tax=Zingiber officinale TaxID=94328 RepID=A0A8J5KSF0_ZINOF|nr:hypothetical protein ZIOFF_046341 [Zingiber officinale]
MHNLLDYLPEQTATFPELSVLMLQQNKLLNLIPKSFFSSLPALTFLDLSGTNIRKLPSDINMLSELQYLNLSFTRVEALPVELSGLVKLKYLLLEKTKSLVQVPKGTISNLRLLKLLNLYQSKYADLDELKGFPGCRKNIGITLHSMTNLERLGFLSQLSTWKLQLQNLRDLAYPSQLFENIMSSHNTRRDLERLEIVNVRTGGELTVARSKDHKEGLKCLRYMTLKNVHYLREITWKAVEPQTIFPNLHELTIDKCNKLINITWVLHLPNLSVLKVSNCDEMKELISCVESSVNSSIGLRLLSLDGLPKLNCISRQPLTFPYLVRIDVISCYKIRKLPFGAEICQHKLKRIICDEDWWEMIQWENVNDKNSLTPYFKLINSFYSRSDYEYDCVEPGRKKRRYDLDSFDPAWDSFDREDSFDPEDLLDLAWDPQQQGAEADLRATRRS